METPTLISSGLSVLATVATFYFWLIRSSKERANLKTHLVAAPSEPHQLGWNRDMADGKVYYLAYLRLAVANYSSLPNALIACDMWVKGKQGEWLPLKVAVRWNNVQSFELPLNIPALQTIPLNAWLELKPNAETTERNGFLQCVASPVEFKVELTALGRRKFIDAVAAT